MPGLNAEASEGSSPPKGWGCLNCRKPRPPHFGKRGRVKWKGVDIGLLAYGDGAQRGRRSAASHKIVPRTEHRSVETFSPGASLKSLALDTGATLSTLTEQSVSSPPVLSGETVTAECQTDTIHLFQCLASRGHKVSCTKLQFCLPQVKEALPEPFTEPDHSIQPGDYVVVKVFRRKTCLEPRWQGPYLVMLTAHSAIKLKGAVNWMHVSQCKKVGAELNPDALPLEPLQKHKKTETASVPSANKERSSYDLRPGKVATTPES
ncbi:uncharacterized protein LOC133373457 [Rhineura floridana]|uniref:uncharacterized protein LOC133373457 n=1 Tax=Rhineura floridana TaxID=261503 RepID=UPI002AC872AE|nr:uncharacterized protein LOC133373457 [Rhineura floridana]